jgi:hypothetical protein
MKMKRLATMIVIVIAGSLGACEKEPSHTITEVPVYPVVVGEKNELYEVLTPNSVRLAPGVKARVIDVAGGKNNGFEILQRDNSSGGFIVCTCDVGGMTGSCKATSDNPENNPTCEGGCTDSEGNPHSCMKETIIGPPKDPPTMIKLYPRESKP